MIILKYRPNLSILTLLRIRYNTHRYKVKGAINHFQKKEKETRKRDRGKVEEDFPPLPPNKVTSSATYDGFHQLDECSIVAASRHRLTKHGCYH